jgi:hypothetical protein
MFRKITILICDNEIRRWAECNWIINAISGQITFFQPIDQEEISSSHVYENKANQTYVNDKIDIDVCASKADASEIKGCTAANKSSLV